MRLLCLDPLTLLRCLRTAGTALAGNDAPVKTIPELVDRLGRSFVLRAFRVEQVDCDSARNVHGLWMHSVATAFAAQELAGVSELMTPDEGYMRGLLRHLPRWLRLLGEEVTSTAELVAVAERWKLPRELVDTAADGSEAQLNGELNAEDDENLLVAAEVLADLADFPAPGDEDSIDRGDLLASISRESLVQARELRRRIHRALEEHGLDTSVPSVPEGAPDRTDKSPLFWIGPVGNQTEFMVSLLLCRQSSTYRSIVTVATAAALRYLDFDRALFVTWNREGDHCFVKAKADFTICRLTPQKQPLTESESNSLREALASERPYRLTRRPGESAGLLDLIGADEAMVVMVSREFETPTFLILDRTMSLRGLDTDVDPINAAALGGTVAVLTDNLKLRLERIRAQRFAVIDPLTRLNNRAVGLMALEREMIRARREGLPLSVLMLDLDEFKDLNDTHGHLVGDQALRLTAKVLRRTLRRSDVLCRYGGEEFLVVLPATAPDEASVLAARLFVEVAASGEEYRLPLTVSIGLSCLREADERIDDIVGRADRALYASKTRGRNRFSADISEEPADQR